jgi:hypothetical protein
VRKGDRYFADVFEVPQGSQPSKPHVVPELAQMGTQWIFENFHYPDETDPQDENLVSTLKMLRESRERPKR